METSLLRHWLLPDGLLSASLHIRLRTIGLSDGLPDWLWHDCLSTAGLPATDRPAAHLSVDLLPDGCRSVMLPDPTSSFLLSIFLLPILCAALLPDCIQFNLQPTCHVAGQPPIARAHSLRQPDTPGSASRTTGASQRNPASIPPDELFQVECRQDVACQQVISGMIDGEIVEGMTSKSSRGVG